MACQGWGKIDPILTAWDWFRHQSHQTLQWCHNERDGVSNHRPHECLFNRLFRHRWKKTSKLLVTGLCVGNSLVTGEFPAQRASDVENVSIWIGLHLFNDDTRPERHISGLNFHLMTSACLQGMRPVTRPKYRNLKVGLKFNLKLLKQTFGTIGNANLSALRDCAMSDGKTRSK